MNELINIKLSDGAIVPYQYASYIIDNNGILHVTEQDSVTGKNRTVASIASGNWKHVWVPKRVSSNYLDLSHMTDEINAVIERHLPKDFSGAFSIDIESED